MIWLEGAQTAARALLIAGCLVGAGRVLVTLLHKVPTQGAFWAVIACIGALVGFALQSAALAGNLDGAWNRDMLGILWRSSQGTSLVLHLSGAALLLGGSVFSITAATVAGALVMLSGFLAVGHVATLDMLWVQVVLYLHLWVAAYWVGVFGPLSQLARTDPKLAGHLGHMFGRNALLAIPFLVSLGLLLAWSLVESIAHLITTLYGQMLLLKIAGVSAMLILGALNKMRHVPRVLAGGSAEPLRRSVQYEAIVAAFAIIATASFSTFAGLA